VGGGNGGVGVRVEEGGERFASLRRRGYLNDETGCSEMIEFSRSRCRA